MQMRRDYVCAEVFVSDVTETLPHTISTMGKKAVGAEEGTAFVRALV